jgi:enterochelin esterase-like enzyme
LTIAASLAGCTTNPPAEAQTIVQATPFARMTPPARTPVPTWTLPFKPTLPPSATPLRPPEALFTATPSPIACVETQGIISQISVPSSTLRYPIDARIYLPPCYAASDRRYPVLYLIHGLNFKEDQWERLGATQTADALTEAGEIAPLVMVMPRDRRDSRLDRAFVTDLIPYIDTHYRTLADRQHRAIGGLSRGAGWAIHIGLQYPAVFARLGAHSPAIFYGDEQKIINWTHHLPDDQVPAIYFDIGEQDAERQSAHWFDQVLTWFQVEHTYILRSGGHSEKYWSAHMAEYLRFYAADWLKPAATPLNAPDEAEQP